MTYEELRIASYPKVVPSNRELALEWCERNNLCGCFLESEEPHICIGASTHREGQHQWEPLRSIIPIW